MGNSPETLLCLFRLFRPKLFKSLIKKGDLSQEKCQFVVNVCDHNWPEIAIDQEKQQCVWAQFEALWEIIYLLSHATVASSSWWVASFWTLLESSLKCLWVASSGSLVRLNSLSFLSIDTCSVLVCTATSDAFNYVFTPSERENNTAW